MMVQSSFTSKDASRFGEILRNKNKPLKERFRALFVLKTIGGPHAVLEIANAFDDPSALLKHELAFCLGQIRDHTAIPFLEKVLSNPDEDAMVRHEAAEALGAIGDESSIDFVRKFIQDPAVEVSETCEIANERLQWFNSSLKDEALLNSPYLSVDPAPALPETSGEQAVMRARDVLLDESQTLFNRYRALFYLRNDGCESAIQAICDALSCPKSALFRHEVAYVLGQLQSPMAVEALAANLGDTAENGMVRHECAEALGSIGTDKCVTILQGYLHDECDVVRESCEVALDMAEYD